MSFEEEMLVAACFCVCVIAFAIYLIFDRYWENKEILTKLKTKKENHDYPTWMTITETTTHKE